MKKQDPLPPVKGIGNIAASENTLADLCEPLGERRRYRRQPAAGRGVLPKAPLADDDVSPRCFRGKPNLGPRRHL